MGQVKQQAMEDAEKIFNKTADALVDGQIDEDDALEILDKNMDVLLFIGFENKYDALAGIYEYTEDRGVV
jgi:hypothetical protein